MRVQAARVLACLACLAALCATGAANAARSAGPPIAAGDQALPKFQNNVTLRWIGAGNWELYVENTNETKFINAFEWDPPAGLTIRSITSSPGGRCSLVAGNIRCAGNIAPIPCGTCPGSGMTIDFRGSGFDSKWVPTSYGGYWIAFGWQAGNLSVTSVSSFADLPRCAKGQVGTAAKPCSKT
ncbi:MAG TPA: hypothetical protein VFA88_04875 [Gaiellaceae bacterium]|nr:hypothetical protein [Gaiellaceae bacterium]